MLLSIKQLILAGTCNMYSCVLLLDDFILNMFSCNLLVDVKVFLKH